METNTIQCCLLGYDMAIKHYNPQQLWLPVQDLHNIKPIKIQALLGKSSHYIPNLLLAGATGR